MEFLESANVPKKVYFSNRGIIYWAITNLSGAVEGPGVKNKFPLFPMDIGLVDRPMGSIEAGCDMESQMSGISPQQASQNGRRIFCLLKGFSFFGLA